MKSGNNITRRDSMPLCGSVSDGSKEFTPLKTYPTFPVKIG